MNLYNYLQIKKSIIGVKYNAVKLFNYSMKNNSNITFVTSYYKIYDEEYCPYKTFEKRLPFFYKLADIGINICIFISPEFTEKFIEMENKYKNIKAYSTSIPITELKFSPNYFLEIKNCVLPEKRNYSKDTENYMYLMNSKIDFVREAIEKDYFSTDYFCWIDFSLPYVFKNSDETIEKIKIMSQHNYTRAFLTIPGCWNVKINDINFIKNNICWRFSGGFFMGDKNSLMDFYNISFTHFGEFLTHTKTLLWEVNYWAWLEAFKEFNPIWYYGDHNDTIIDIPEHLFIIKN